MPVSIITSHILAESNIGAMSPRSPLCACRFRFRSRSAASSRCQSIVVPSAYGTLACAASVSCESVPFSRSSKEGEVDVDVLGLFVWCVEDWALNHGMFCLELLGSLYCVSRV